MSWKLAVGTIVALAVIAFAYYAVSPLFISIRADDDVPGEAEQSQEASAQDVEESTATQPAPVIESQPIQSVGAEVVGTLGHPASGIARIVRDQGKTYLRYEDFTTINGPDLFVYLASDTKATEFVNLGALKATEGNVNYEIPPGTDLSKYPFALVWCRAFGVLFNSADLSAI